MAARFRLEFVLIARTFQVDVLDTIRREPAAEPLHQRIVLPFPNYVWVPCPIPERSGAVGCAF